MPSGADTRCYSARIMADVPKASGWRADEYAHVDFLRDSPMRSVAGILLAGFVH